MQLFESRRAWLGRRVMPDLSHAGSLHRSCYGNVGLRGTTDRRARSGQKIGDQERGGLSLPGWTEGQDGGFRHGGCQVVAQHPQKHSIGLTGCVAKANEHPELIGALIEQIPERWRGVLGSLYLLALSAA